jgi:hypothetical protein
LNNSIFSTIDAAAIFLLSKLPSMMIATSYRFYESFLFEHTWMVAPELTWSYLIWQPPMPMILVTKF